MDEKRNRIQLSFFGFLLFCCPFVFAKQTNQYILGLDLGISAINHLGNQASFPLGYSTFIYTPKKDSDNPLYFGVTLSKSINFSSLNSMQIGFSYQNITKMNINGSLEQGISPPFPSFNYNYSIKSAQLLVEGKFLHQWSNLFYPYLLAGIGLGFNKAANYSTTIPPYLTLTPYYSDKSMSSLSYQIGLGVDFFKFQPLVIGLGYRFSDLGQLKLGNGQIQNRYITSQFRQSHLYLNTLLFELTCFF